ADERALVHLLREQRHRLRERDAWHVGLDRLELAADVGRRIRLRIPDVDVARAALEVDQDHRFGGVPAVLGTLRRRVRRSFAGGQELRQAKPQQRRSPYLKQLAPRYAVAQPSPTTRYRQHARFLRVTEA